MTDLGPATAAPDKIVLALVSYLDEGQIDDGLELFADGFSFNDRGIGLEINTKGRLTEFF